jgi:hypothetical protein
LGDVVGSVISVPLVTTNLEKAKSSARGSISYILN